MEIPVQIAKEQIEKICKELDSLEKTNRQLMSDYAKVKNKYSDFINILKKIKNSNPEDCTREELLISAINLEIEVYDKDRR